MLVAPVYSCISSGVFAKHADVCVASISPPILYDMRIKYRSESSYQKR